MFNVLDLTKNDIVMDHLGDPVVWETGKEAAEYCELYNRAYGNNRKVLQPQKAVVDKDWKSREQEKFDSGKYSLPDFLKPFSLPNHYLHVSSNRIKLAYTKDNFRGAQNIQTQISFEGYFEKYWPDLSRPIYDSLAQQWGDLIMEFDGLKITMDSEEIKEIYTNFDEDQEQLSGSCMRGEFDTLPDHPVVVYGGGDLGIAYLQNARGETTARTLIWPEKKFYSRVYGDPNIHSLLKIRGYKKCAYYRDHPNNTFVGAKLKRVPVGKHFLMPYFDEPCLRAEDRKDHLVLIGVESESRANTRFSHGTSGQDPNYTCENCHEDIDDGDVCHVNNRRGTTQIWCLSCRGDYAFFCARTESYYENGQNHRDDFGEDDFDESLYLIRMSNGELWSRRAFDNYGFTCQKTGRKHNRNQHRLVITPVGQQSWCATALSQSGWTCAVSNQHYSNEMPSLKLNPSGAKIHVSSVNDNPDYTTEDGGLTYTRKWIPHHVPTVQQPPATSTQTNLYKQGTYASPNPFNPLYTSVYSISPTITENYTIPVAPPRRSDPT